MKTRFQTLIAIGVAGMLPGYYLVLLFWQGAAGTLDGSTVFMMIYRASILLLFSLILLKVNTIKKINFDSLLLYTFFTVYFLSILYFILLGHTFHRNPSIILLYFLGFVCIPVVAILNLPDRLINHKSISNMLQVVGISFSIMCIINYGSDFFTGLRAKIIFGDTDVLSPISVSYVGALLFSLSFHMFLEDRSDRVLICIAGMILGIIACASGASRGAALAILACAVCSSLTSRNRMISLLVLSLIIVVLITQLDDFYIISRLFKISSAIEESSGEGSRVLIWYFTLEQFLASPLIPSSLESSFVRYYPHNIILEVAISTGITGLILFLILVFRAFKQTIRWSVTHDDRSYLLILLITGFSYHFFSGALYFASWLFVPVAFIARRGHHSQS